MINKLYGVLSTVRGAMESENPGWRYSDVKANANQRSILYSLMDTTTEDTGVFIDFIIRLLSASPYWPNFIREVDPDNTYDVSVIVHGDTAHTLPFSVADRLAAWEASTVVSSEKYPYTENDPYIDRLTAKLLTVVDDNE